MAAIDVDGFALVPAVLSSAEVRNLSAVLGDAPTGGHRGMLAHAEVAELARSPKVLALVHSHLSTSARPVRALLFDKSPEANWLVPWHQDLTIAVREQRDVPGFGPWSVKDGVTHVQPPTELLERMLAVRIHLDPVDQSNGALRVLPGTHRLGKLAPEEIDKLRRDRDEVCCTARAGDVLLIRPLVLHASSKAASPTRRRVLHIEYADFDLPHGLDWHHVA
jgi:ectoine hydroxylase-related dioxygenase (phytanoyl-CoA dioxygenase family)